MHMRQQVRVAHAGGRRLLLVLETRECREPVVTHDVVDPVRHKQRLQRIPDAGLPVNQRAVYIKGQYFKVGQFHIVERALLAVGSVALFKHC